VHHPEMVRSGVTIDASAGASRYRPGEIVSVTLTLENTRIGHAFPTYVTPRVVLSVELVDQAGKVVVGSREEKVIAREVRLDLQGHVERAPRVRASAGVSRNAARQAIRVAGREVEMVERRRARP